MLPAYVTSSSVRKMNEDAYVLRRNTSACDTPGCNELGLKHCSSCRDASYCSVKCQKDDWKTHKKTCSKRMPEKLLPICEVVQVIKRSFDQGMKFKFQGRADAAIEVLENAVAFVDNQIGPRIVGETYRIRRNGDRVNNWQSVTMPVCLLLIQLTSLLIDLRTTAAFDRALIHGTEARELIEPQRGTLQYGELDYLHILFYQVELQLAEIYSEKFEFVKAESHCQECLILAKKSNGDIRTSSVCQALRVYSCLRRSQGRFKDAVSMAEEAYITASEAHCPEHPKVQEVAADLIDCLILTEQFSQAEAYARITYESLIDPSCGIDQNSEQIARGMQQLAFVLLLIIQHDKEASPDILIEAEKLIRQSCTVVEKLFGRNTPNLALCLDTFGKILVERGSFTEETRDAFMRVVCIYESVEGGRERGTVLALQGLGDYLVKMSDVMPDGEERSKEREQAVATYTKAADISSSINGPTHSTTRMLLKCAADVNTVGIFES
jgi:tetratricopeptide (TPR) repeat protein